MAWNYHDDDLPGPPAAVRIDIDGIPSGARVESLRHYQIDQEHGNAYTAWKKMGSPQDPTPEQYASLERAGQLQLVGPPAQIRSKDGMVSVSFDLPRQGVSLIQLEWSVGR